MQMGAKLLGVMGGSIMYFSPNKPATRLPSKQVTLSQGQFCRWLAKEKGVSAEALMEAMCLISAGMQLAIARGYRILWRGLLSIELRETKERRRWHRVKKVMYTQPPFCRVHIKTSTDLNTRIRTLAKSEIAKAVRQIPLSYPGHD